MTLAEEIAKVLISCFIKGSKVLVCGNGGSAAQADHFAGELICKLKEWRTPLPAISLSANTAVITAIANDLGFQYVYSRQVEAFAKKGDVLITLSTSGKSKNILQTHAIAKYLGMKVIQFPTNKELKLDTQATQLYHLKLLHDIAKEVEEYCLQDSWNGVRD